MRMTLTAEDLLHAIERRLAEISELQHRLALERARLQAQTTPLRLGVISPEAVLTQLKLDGVTLTGVTVHPQAQPRTPKELPRS
jgi:hypothetical protein